MDFVPDLNVLPAPQRTLWPELASTPTAFTLYGGTALALRLGHRTSVDFDFFSNDPFDPDHLARDLAYLEDAQKIQVCANTLTCRVQRDGPVLVSFFGGLGLGQVAACDMAADIGLQVASLQDIGGTKAAVVQKRAEAKDYLDMDALLRHGVDLPTILAAGKIVYGHGFNPLITLKALCFFADVPSLPLDVQDRLVAAVSRVDVTKLPLLVPYRMRSHQGAES